MQSKRPSVWLGNLGLSLAAVLLFLVGIEGLASGLLLARDLFDATDATATRPTVAERRHTQYDAELGWVNLTSHSVEGLYGPGADLHTNAQGFRGKRDTEPSPAPGVFRVVCSGDSFTLGVGVADDETWCHRLKLPGRKVETVNMGQGGYGIDQAWLWYERDGKELGHKLHIFAFVYPDISRMTEVTFLGYGKPRVRHGPKGFRLENVPVPQAGMASGWLRRHRESFGSLRVFRLLSPLLSGRLPETDAGSFPRYGEKKAVAVALEIFADVNRSNLDLGSQTVIVYLTSWLDLRKTPEKSRLFREDFASELAQRSVHFIDLTDDFRTLPPAALEAMFIRPNDTPYDNAKGHYTARGNAFVAKALSRRLDSLLGSIPKS